MYKIELKYFSSFIFKKDWKNQVSVRDIKFERLYKDYVQYNILLITRSLLYNFPNQPRSPFRAMCYIISPPSLIHDEDFDLEMQGFGSEIWGFGNY